MTDNMWSKFKEEHKEEIENGMHERIFFKPKIDEEHTFTLASPIQVSERAFKPSSPMRWTADMRFTMLDGKKTNIEWGTQSKHIICVLGKYCDNAGNLKKGYDTFRLKMIKKNAKTMYQFELIK